jgi:hypothetical protein
MLRSCGTQPRPGAVRASGGSRIASRPPIAMRSPNSRVAPIAVAISVVLPMPWRSSSATASPSATSSDTACSTRAPR